MQNIETIYAEKAFHSDLYGFVDLRIFQDVALQRRMG
jgi:hypothetical protein